MIHVALFFCFTEPSRGAAAPHAASAEGGVGIDGGPASGSGAVGDGDTERGQKRGRPPPGIRGWGEAVEAA